MFIYFVHMFFSKKILKLREKRTTGKEEFIPHSKEIR